jgi:hypothetical protein
MRAPDDFTGPPNTCDSGVFTAMAMSLLVGHLEGVPRWLGSPMLGCVEATRDCRPLWPIQARPSPGWYGRCMGISTVVVAVKAVSRKLMKRENLSDFRTFCDGRSVSTAEGFVTKLTSHGKPRRPRIERSWTVSSSSSLDVGDLTSPSGHHRRGWRERRAKAFRTASSRRSAIVVTPRAGRLQSTCRCRSRSRSQSGSEGCQDPPLVSC